MRAAGSSVGRGGLILGEKQQGRHAARRFAQARVAAVRPANRPAERCRQDAGATKPEFAGTGPSFTPGMPPNLSGAGVYLFYRERQPAKRGFHQRLFSRAFGPAVSTSIAVCQRARRRLHPSKLAFQCWGGPVFLDFPGS